MFQKTIQGFKTQRAFWEKVRQVFDLLPPEARLLFRWKAGIVRFVFYRTTSRRIVY
jgi:hypothetical protein